MVYPACPSAFEHRVTLGRGWEVTCQCGRPHRAAVPPVDASPADYGRAYLAARAMAMQCPGIDAPGDPEVWHLVTVPEPAPPLPEWARTPCAGRCGLSTASCMGSCWAWDRARPAVNDQ